MAGVLLAAWSVSVATQSVDEFDAWMRTIEEKTQAVQQHIAKRDAVTAAADARVLADTFARVEEFWVRRGDAVDAAQLSKDARERAAGIEQAVSQQDFDRASSESIKVAETCTPCHRLYRPFP